MAFLTAALLVTVVVAGLLDQTKPTAALTPLIFVPGYTCNKLKVLNALDGSDTFLWPNADYADNSTVDGWLNKMKLVYSSITKQTHSGTGLTVYAPGYGSADSVRYVVNDQGYLNISYLDNFVTTAINQWGYVDNVNIRGAPYDWRHGNTDADAIYLQLKTLVEETYALNGGKKVALLGHSQGAVMTLYFLQNYVTQIWKDTFIEVFISAAGPFGGHVFLNQALISGWNVIYGPVPTILKVREADRSFSWTYNDLPTGGPLWSSSDVLVQTPTFNYTINTYPKLYADLGLPHGMQMHQAFNYQNWTKAPGVKVACVVGSGFPSPIGLVYAAGAFPDGTPSYQYADGDAFVAGSTQAVCQSWEATNGKAISYKTLAGLNHLTMLQDDTALSYYKSLLNVN